MQYVTHHFASHETLARARRWLAQVGFDPSQIEAHTDGVPRLAMMVRPEQVDEVQSLINAAELSDPAGWPSFWDVAQQTHVYPISTETAATTRPEPPHSHAVGWHPVDVIVVGTDKVPPGDVRHA